MAAVPSRPGDLSTEDDKTQYFDSFIERYYSWRNIEDGIESKPNGLYTHRFVMSSSTRRAEMANLPARWRAIRSINQTDMNIFALSVLPRGCETVTDPLRRQLAAAAARQWNADFFGKREAKFLLLFLPSGEHSAPGLHCERCRKVAEDTRILCGELAIDIPERTVFGQEWERVVDPESTVGSGPKGLWSTDWAKQEYERGKTWAIAEMRKEKGLPRNPSDPCLSAAFKRIKNERHVVLEEVAKIHEGPRRHTDEQARQGTASNAEARAHK